MKTKNMEEKILKFKVGRKELKLIPQKVEREKISEKKCSESDIPEVNVI